MVVSDDTYEIHARLQQNVEAVLSALYPGWMEVRGKALLTPQKKHQRYSSSFVVYLNGDKRGSWNRYSQKIGGSMINLIAYALTGRHKGRDEYRIAYDWARDYFGLERSRLSPDERARLDQERKQRQAEEEKQRTERERRAKRRRALKIKTANEIAAECHPIGSTIGETYLTRRRFPPVKDWPDDQRDHIGFHEAVEYDPLRVYDEDGHVIEFGPTFPALVFFIRDPFGDIVALQRIFLSSDGGKLETERPDLDTKVQLGPVSGGAIRIGGHGPRVGLVEGPETALGAWFLHRHRFPVWSALSTAGLTGFQPPPFIERIDLFEDGDRAEFDERQGRVLTPPGARATQSAAPVFKALGLDCVVQPGAALGDNHDLWEIYVEHAG
ncbi:MAG: hypothetical protein JJ902_05270 [Roseibium sp.]|nr:hypothetical protein [Roseibium sp.]